jgi:16S rRNA (cytosine1402-N4)-methyltransferase
MHTPVLFTEVMSALQPKSRGRYLDATVGGGGHAEGLLQGSAPEGRVLGTDADASAITRSAERLASFGERVVLRQAWLDEAPALAQDLSFVPLDGVLVDLGLSSNQLNDAGRGFSFMRDGSLDMRFDTGGGVSAAELINRLDVTGLTRLLREYGDVARARQVAEAIWSARPVTTTAQLREAVAGVARSRGQIHPATQVFQAFRIAVNDEVRRLSDALPKLMEILAPGGRLAVITFHSLEDRIAKQVFREAAIDPVDQPGFGERIQVVRARVRLVTRKPIVATTAEVEMNPRARSAKLRVVEKLA